MSTGVSMQEELLFPSFSYYLDEAAKEHYRELLIHHKLWVLLISAQTPKPRILAALCNRG